MKVQIHVVVEQTQLELAQAGQWVIEARDGRKVIRDFVVPQEDLLRMDFFGMKSDFLIFQKLKNSKYPTFTEYKSAQFN